MPITLYRNIVWKILLSFSSFRGGNVEKPLFAVMLPESRGIQNIVFVCERERKREREVNHKYM